MLAYSVIVVCSTRVANVNPALQAMPPGGGATEPAALRRTAKPSPAATVPSSASEPGSGTAGVDPPTSNAPLVVVEVRHGPVKLPFESDATVLLTPISLSAHPDSPLPPAATIQ